jgi:hypothetical protein
MTTEVDMDRNALAPETSDLATLEAGGFSAHVDAYAWEASPDKRQMHLWFLSLLGPSGAVKALWARLLKGEVATLGERVPRRARFCSLRNEGMGSWRFLTATLPRSAGYHGVLLPEVARFHGDRPDFLLLARPDDAPAALHYRFLTRRLDLPLHPSWSDWLWARALDCGEAVALEAHSVNAYRCLPNAEALAVALTLAVRAGKLRA